MVGVDGNAQFGTTLTGEETTPTAPTSSSGGTSSTGSTGLPTTEPVGSTTAGPDSDLVYDPTFVHELDIEMTDLAYSELAANSEAYNSTYWVEADVTFDGERLEQVGVRLKGRWGSWRSLSQKAGFKVDMNHYVSGQRLHGVKTLTLNNMVVDPTFAKEHLAYQAYAAIGVPAPRTAYTWVTLNGEPYGLYLNVESVDDVYLERFWDEPDGNLYDADYVLFSDGSYATLDFFDHLVGYYELEEGEDIGNADLQTVTDLLDEVEGHADFYARSAELVDWPAMHRQVAGEMWTGQNDGYSLNRNNYLVYFDPDSDQAYIQPWDHDYAFQYASAWGYNWQAPQGRLTSLCLYDEGCRADQLAVLEEAFVTIDALDLPARLWEASDLITPWVRADPRKEISEEYVDDYQRDLERFIVDRTPWLVGQWGL